MQGLLSGLVYCLKTFGLEIYTLTTKGNNKRTVTYDI
jgi:hypothetical protein